MEAVHGGKGAGEPRIRVDLEPDPLLRHCTYVLAAESEDMQAWPEPWRSPVEAGTRVAVAICRLESAARASKQSKL